MTGATLTVRGKIGAFTTTKVGGLLSAILRGRPVTKPVLTFGQAFVAAWTLNLEALVQALPDLDPLTPEQSKALVKVLDEAIAEQQASGLAGLLRQALERLRGSRPEVNLTEAIYAFVAQINDRMATEGAPRLSEAQCDSLAGMMDAVVNP
jgi:hypothetical protein